VNPLYQYSNEVFIFTIYPDKLTIKRKDGLDETNWCALCGKPIVQLSPKRHRKYCSDGCRERYSRSKVKKETLIPLMDIQAMTSEDAGTVLEIWTGIATSQVYYVGNQEELVTLMEAIGNASSTVGQRF